MSEMYQLTVILIYTFLVTNDVELFLHVFIAFLYVFCGEMFIQVTCVLLNRDIFLRVFKFQVFFIQSMYYIFIIYMLYSPPIL